MRRRAFLSLGSNLGDRVATLREAIGSLNDVVGVSTVYETDPVGGPPQAPFLNVVVELSTPLSARELLGEVRRLEDAAQRVRRIRWGPRTLDVDIIWIDGQTVAEPDLEVPHPRWTQRGFVVEPLRELAPELVDRYDVSAAVGDVHSLGPLAELPDEFDHALRAAGPVVRVIGVGRAGTSFAAALSRRNWVVELLARDDSWRDAATGATLVLLCVPDMNVAEVAEQLVPDASCVVAHVSGSLTLEPLRAHHAVASIHPLASLPDGSAGMRRLLAGGYFAVAGTPGRAREVASAVVASLGGTALAVDDSDRALYHAAACVAANHLVGLLGQVERLAALIGVPLEAYLALADPLLGGVGASSAAAALTGPVARRDWPTVARHVAALRERAPDEVVGYLAGAALAAKTAGVELPEEFV